MRPTLQLANTRDFGIAVMLAWVNLSLVALPAFFRMLMFLESSNAGSSAGGMQYFWAILGCLFAYLVCVIGFTGRKIWGAFALFAMSGFFLVFYVWLYAGARSSDDILLLYLMAMILSHLIQMVLTAICLKNRSLENDGPKGPRGFEVIVKAKDEKKEE